MAKHTKQPEVLRQLFEVLGNDPYVIAECLARPILSERLVKKLHTTGIRVVDLRPKTKVAANAQYKLPIISGGANECIDDTWATTSINAPSARYFHTAVWTGSEMIVWGGYNGSDLNSGGRYNPSTDSWIPTSTTNAPSARQSHTAVWTGSEMIVWGGRTDNGETLNTGGRYNPGTDSWIASSTANAPTARADQTAVWTGTEMIVWGGLSPTYVNTGGRYNPSSDTWTNTSITNAPTARYQHAAVWGGSEMIVWGGYYFDGSNHYLDTGGRYNPSTDSWTATTTVNVPVGRQSHTAVWSGSEMIIWGGYYFDGITHGLNSGGRYNPGADSWAATNTIGAATGRWSQTVVWTGSEMIVWGGFDGSDDLNTGGRYNPSSDTWITTSTTNAPSVRYGHTAVWSGSQMIVWGGQHNFNYLNTGGRYCAQTAPVAQSAFSRKTHGAAGTFDVPLPITGNVGIECRSGGNTNDYQMLINFMTNVTVDSASVTSGTGTVSSFTGSGTPTIAVNLTGVTNIQRITMTLHNVNDGTHVGDVPISMGVLIGDTTGNGVVNAGDVSQTKSQVGQAVSGSNFREDVNTSGTITAADVAQVKAKVGTSLPP